MSKDQTVSIFCKVPSTGKITGISVFDVVPRQREEEEQSLLCNWNTVSVLSIPILLFHQNLIGKIRYISHLHHNNSDLN